MERTFLMVKPDGVQRGIIGKIITRMEEKGLKITALKMLRIPKKLASEHYAEHKGKPFYEPLMKFITSGPVVAVVLQGKNAVDIVRRLMGKTDPAEAVPGTIRGDFGMLISRNVVHGSDSQESAKREISLFFNETEISNYTKINEMWLYEWKERD